MKGTKFEDQIQYLMKHS
jgi:hypothetical protein